MTVGEPEIRILEAGDEPLLERYFALRPNTTMFLRSNLHYAGGLGADPTATYGGVHAVAMRDGEVTGVVAHVWNGNAILESDDAPAALTRAALQRSGRTLHGFLGPAEQTEAVRSGLGLGGVPTRMDSRERLYALDTANLRVPADLDSGGVRCRRAVEDDLAFMLDWRMAYSVEAIGAEDTPEAREHNRESVRRGIANDRWFVLEADGEPVSISAFNAWVPDCAQIGGVYTPPPLRSRGYGRAVVAGSLQLAAESGTPRSVLFTDEENVPAQRAYEAIGYEVVGDYAIVFFEQPQDIA